MLPTLREKKRYLAFEIISKRPIKALKSIKKAIDTSVLFFIGIKGSAKAGTMFIEDKYNSSKQRGLIRVETAHQDELKASLALIGKIEDQQVIVRSIGSSGIIKQAEKKYIAG